jgi:hypothetical protein
MVEPTYVRVGESQKGVTVSIGDNIDLDIAYSSQPKE